MPLAIDDPEPLEKAAELRAAGYAFSDQEDLRIRWLEIELEHLADYHSRAGCSRRLTASPGHIGPMGSQPTTISRRCSRGDALLESLLAVIPRNGYCGASRSEMEKRNV
jgi:hypothetical protein